jgi:hypothetical protein
MAGLSARSLPHRRLAGGKAVSPSEGTAVTRPPPERCLASERDLGTSPRPPTHAMPKTRAQPRAKAVWKRAPCCWRQLREIGQQRPAYRG